MRLNGEILFPAQLSKPESFVPKVIDSVELVTILSTLTEAPCPADKDKQPQNMMRPPPYLTVAQAFSE